MSIRLLRLLLLCTFFVSPAQASEIGWVLAYSPLHAAHQIERDAGTQTLSLGTALFADDVIRVVEDGEVRVGFVDGSERQFSGNGRWTVPVVEKRSSVWNAMQSLLGMVNRQGMLAASASTRDSGDCITAEGEPIRLPIFESPQKVVHGIQDIRLAWQGGCPNFSLSLRAGDKELVSRSALKDRSTVLRNVVLRPGKHSIKIAGASKSVEVVFDVVESVPKATDVTAQSSLMHTLLTAASLADYEQGTWRAESLKVLEPLLTQRQPVAIRLADWLLHGKAHPDDLVP